MKNFLKSATKEDFVEDSLINYFKTFLFLEDGVELPACHTVQVLIIISIMAQSEV